MADKIVAVTMPLEKKIQAQGETLTELAFREPDAGDICKSGMPYQTEFSDGKRRMVIDANACLTLIALLCDIPPSAAKKLGAPDFADAQGVIIGFFGESTPEPSSATPSSSPASSTT
jgi:hypothetical protein